MTKSSMIQKKLTETIKVHFHACLRRGCDEPVLIREFFYAARDLVLWPLKNFVTVTIKQGPVEKAECDVCKSVLSDSSN